MATHRFSLYSLALFCLLMVTGVNAAPISFAALTKTTATVPSNLAITVEYTVKNLTSTSQPFVFKGVSGVTSNVGTGLCGNAFTLAGLKSCKLQLVFTGSLMAPKVDGGFKLCPSAASTTCYTPPSTLLAHMTRVAPVTVAPNPAGSNVITILPTETKTVKYNIKNNTAYRLALHWYTEGVIPPAIKQLTGQSGDCATNFALAGQGNCNLRLQITGNLLPPGLQPLPIIVCDPQNTACYMALKAQSLQVSLQTINNDFFIDPPEGLNSGGYSINVISPKGVFLPGPYDLSIQGSKISATFIAPDILTAMIPPGQYQSGSTPVAISKNGQMLGQAMFLFIDNGGPGGYNFTPYPTEGSLKGGYTVVITSSQPLNSSPIMLSVTGFSFNLPTRPISPTQFAVDISAAAGLPIPLPIPPGTYEFNVVQDMKVLGTVQFKFTQ